MNAGTVLVTDGVEYLGSPLAVAFDRRGQTCVFIDPPGEVSDEARRRKAGFHSLFTPARITPDTKEHAEAPILTLAAGKVNQVYNVADGDRSALNDQYGMMKTLLSGNFAHVPEYVDFRRGDVRHSQADISRAVTLLGYVPTHRINDGMREARDWTVHALSH